MKSGDLRPPSLCGDYAQPALDWRTIVSMRLRDPGGIDRAVQILRDCASQIGNTTFSGRGSNDARDAWLRWWDQTDRQLRNLFADTELAADLFRTQLEIQRMGEEAMPYVHLNRVVDVWRTRLNEAVEHLEALRGFATRPGRIVVADTSAFIEGSGLMDANWRQIARAPEAEAVRLIIPILVVEELDDLKRSRNPRVMERARATLKTLWASLHNSAGEVIQPQVTAEVLLDDLWHSRRRVNDVEIVDRASYVKEVTGRQVVLAATD